MISSQEILVVCIISLMFTIVSSGKSCKERVKNAKYIVNNLDTINEECNADIKCKVEEPTVKSVWATYVRWGRTVCPRTAKVLYEGIAGGSHVSNTGGGANYVCLPKKPEYGTVISGVGRVGGYMYGAEYQLRPDHSNPFVLPNPQNVNSLYNQDVPCTVCQIPRGVVMIPAKRTCPEGWTFEYRGYLVSEHHAHPNNVVFECMDEAPETSQGGHEDKEGALFYSVQGVCGSLPCPDYVNGAELTCVVCSK
ncbi:unnamed protein product [Owenia fusiformis]|uniref:Uncharacterized protein n=1 Tax=Owenia fusiformis TaxID=6347 RepID=A0A8J1XJK3_OWEFU|nr:unnamed protein product [Owenia fusiformis]